MKGTKKDSLRILHLSAADFQFGGVEKFIYNYYENIDRDKLQFDVCFAGKLLSNDLALAFKEKGAKLFFLNMKSGAMRIPTSFLKVFNFLKLHPYKIVHINNGGLAFHAVASLACKLTGVSSIICHLHSFSGDRTAQGFRRLILRLRLHIDRLIVGLCATHILTCSIDLAKYNLGKNLFNKFNVKFIPNAFNVEKFSPNIEIRTEARKKLGITDEFVFCHVGRFHPIKNHEFLLFVFKKIIEMHPNSILLLVGDGELKNKIEELVFELKLSRQVKFLGTNNDVNQFLQASDVFVLPSKSEGLPIVLLEAQCAGNACVVADTVTQEANVSQNVKFLSLKADKNQWALICLEQAREVKKYKKTNFLINTCYEIEKSSRMLQQIYFNCISS